MQHKNEIEKLPAEYREYTQEFARQSRQSRQSRRKPTGDVALAVAIMNDIASGYVSNEASERDRLADADIDMRGYVPAKSKVFKDVVSDYADQVSAGNTYVPRGLNAEVSPSRESLGGSLYAKEPADIYMSTHSPLGYPEYIRHEFPPRLVHESGTIHESGDFDFVAQPEQSTRPESTTQPGDTVPRSEGEAGEEHMDLTSKDIEKLSGALAIYNESKEKEDKEERSASRKGQAREIAKIALVSTLTPHVLKFSGQALALAGFGTAELIKMMGFGGGANVEDIQEMIDEAVKEATSAAVAEKKEAAQAEGDSKVLDALAAISAQLGANAERIEKLEKA